MTHKEIKTLEQVARKVLERDVRSRKDTKWFVLQVLREYGVKAFIDYRDLAIMPSFESILKTKRTIQNKNNEFNDCFISEPGVTYESKK